jgi:MoxR-like ATPase
MSVTTAQNLFRAPPRQIEGFIEECLYSNLVPFVRSSPGMGKSTIVRKIARKLKLKLIDHRLSTSEPTDLSGLPHFVNNRARFVPFDELFPIVGTPLPEGFDGWLIFFDEFNSASKAVQAASYKVILDRMVGQHRLHENVVIVCAGNLDTDRAITNPISTAMQSRVVHLEMDLNPEEWMQDIALAEGYDARIIAYLSQYPSKLMDFRPDHNEKTFCCPRTWEFMNRLIQGREVTEEKAALYAGTITSGVAVDFIQFTKVFETLVSVKEIQADPENCPIPEDISAKWALISHMMEKLDEKNFGDLSVYANRFPLTFRILFFRSVMVRNQKLRNHAAFGKAMTELSRYLNS